MRRLMVYGSSIATGGEKRFFEQLAARLDATAPDRSWTVDVVASPVDDAGLPVALPPRAQILQSPFKIEREHAYLNARSDHFEAVTARSNKPHDLLFLPSPWRNIPLGSNQAISAPVVVSIHDFDFERCDYGIITDQHRRESRKLQRLASAFTFSSPALRDEAVARFGFPAQRCHVLTPDTSAYQAPTSNQVDDARKRYALPARFAFSLRPFTRKRNGLQTVDGFSRFLLRTARDHPDSAPLALITAGIPFDDVLPVNQAHHEYRLECLKRLAACGSTSRDLGPVGPEDIPLLIAAAEVIIVSSFSEAGPTAAMLQAYVSGTPIICSDIAPFHSWSHSSSAIAAKFPPNEPDELARCLENVLGKPLEAKHRSQSALAAAAARQSPSLEDQYWGLFDDVTSSIWRSRPKQRAEPMVSRERRMAWLINHTTLRDAELPIIRSFGMEVYTSKGLPAGDDFRTASIDYSEDEQSTLPNWVLARLNSNNFYEDGIPDSIAELLNGYFATVVCTSYFPPLRDLVRKFRGRILVRVFGREHPHNYGEYFSYMGQGDFWRHVWRAQERFWFTPCYDAIPEIEDELVRHRSIVLPLALPDRILRRKGQWTGGDNRIFFLCPRIKTAAGYYGVIYDDFKRHFGHLPHIVAGHQPIPVDDPNVTGFVSDDQMQGWFRNLAVMFYHSREPRHLHYHPLEAVAYGMPLIFMRGGLVDTYMGVRDAPGGCDSYEEAEHKLRAILAGDQSLVREVVESQVTLLNEFDPAHVRERWRERFYDGIMATSRVANVRPLRSYRGDQNGTVDLQRASAPLASLAVYAQTVPGGGIFKYITGLTQAVATAMASTEAPVHLYWGLPSYAMYGTYAAPKWPVDVPANLHIVDLRPSSDQRRDFPDAASASTFGSDAYEAAAALDDSEFLKHPPRSPGMPRLIEKSCPPDREYLTMDDLRALCSRHGVLYLPNPYRLISPNMDLRQATRLPVVVTIFDLAHEYTEAWGPNSDSVSREMELWSRIATEFVFCSRFIRDESVRLYNIAPERTHVVAQPPMILDRSQPTSAQIKEARAELGLPPRYMFNSGFQGTHKNNIVLFEALGILKRRGFATPPLVIGGIDARRLLLGAPLGPYLEAAQESLRGGGLSIGEDIVIVDYIEESLLSAVYAASALNISVSRSEAGLHGMVTESMFFEAPLIVSNIRQNTDEIGQDDEMALTVPPDDPVGLADAIEYTFGYPAETDRRVRRAKEFITQRSWAGNGKSYLDIFGMVLQPHSPN